MGIAAAEHEFTGSTGTSYDSTRTTMGSLMVQKTGDTAEEKWIGPFPIVLGRKSQLAAGAISTDRQAVLAYNSNIDYIFACDTSVTATRRISMHEYNRTTQTLLYRGMIVMSMPFAGTQGTYTSTGGLSVSRHLYTTGTVAVSGTAVTGTTTAWQTARFAAGARIGFGSTNPDSVTTWYDIATITNDTSITLVGSAGTIAGGTAFVIEELRICYICTNGTTTTNGGLFLVKGINPDTFDISAPSIPAATTVDNIRAVYWLVDTIPTTMTVGSGGDMDTAVSNTEHDYYFVNNVSATTCRIFKFNIRAALSLTGGRDSTALLLQTGTSAALGGNIITFSNGKIFTLQHGSSAGEKSMFINATAKMYRVPVKAIQASSVSFIREGMNEIPPGTLTTITPSASMQNTTYDTITDRLFIAGTTNVRHYYTRFGTNAETFDGMMGIWTQQLFNRELSSADYATYYSNIVVPTVSISNGLLYLNNTGGSNDFLTVVPIGVDWNYASTTGQRVITPALTLSNVKELLRAYANADLMLGSDNLGTATEPFRLYARTSGIADNTGEWTLLRSTGDLSSFNKGPYEATPTQIQLMIEFRICGWTSLPARIHSVTVLYETMETDTHYQASIQHSDKTNRRFAWRFSTAFGTTVPPLQVRLYDAVTGDLLVIDSTDTAVGTFERTTDGGVNWSAWNNTDKGNETTYIRYTPVNIPNRTIRMVLIQK